MYVFRGLSQLLLVCYRAGDGHYAVAAPTRLVLCTLTDRSRSMPVRNLRGSACAGGAVDVAIERQVPAGGQRLRLHQDERPVASNVEHAVGALLRVGLGAVGSPCAVVRVGQHHVERGRRAIQVGAQRRRDPDRRDPPRTQQAPVKRRGPMSRGSVAALGDSGVRSSAVACPGPSSGRCPWCPAPSGSLRNSFGGAIVTVINWRRCSIRRVRPPCRSRSRPRRAARPRQRWPANVG